MTCVGYVFAGKLLTNSLLYPLIDRRVMRSVLNSYKYSLLVGCSPDRLYQADPTTRTSYQGSVPGTA